MNDFVINHFLLFCAIGYGLVFGLAFVVHALIAAFDKEWRIALPGIAKFCVLFWVGLMAAQLILYAFGVK